MQEQVPLTYWQRETEPRSKAVFFPRNCLTILKIVFAAWRKKEQKEWVTTQMLSN